MKNLRKATRLSLELLLIILFLLSVSSVGYCEEATFGPGFQYLDWSIVPLDDDQSSGGGQGQIMMMQSQGGVSEANEIIELARGLKYDPDLMYQFVHDNISFTPMPGYVKGAYMTLMDRSGDDFDQASLLIALLKQAALYNSAIADPCYFYGKIQLTLSQAANWLGTPEDINVIAKDFNELRIKNSNGNFYTWTISGGIYTIYHTWVGVKIDGNEYVFDPSMKSHRCIAGIDLAMAMGYKQTDFLNGAKYNAYVDSNYVRQLNKSNITTALSTYSSNLIAYIKNNDPGTKLEDIIGGKTIIPASETTLRQTHLPYEDLNCVPENWSEWIDSDSLLDKRRSWLNIKLPGNSTWTKLYSSDIYGKRLTVTYNFSMEPELKLDGILKDYGPATTTGSGQNIGVYVFTLGKIVQDANFNVIAGESARYNIVNGWGYTGPGIVEKHREILEQKRFDGESDTSEDVVCQTFALVGFTWLAERSRQDQLLESITDSTYIQYNTVGVCGQYTGPYIDMPGVLSVLITHNNNEAATWNAAWLSSAGGSSAFEHGVINQFQSYGAASTISLLDIANDLDMSGGKCKLYNVRKDNYQNVLQEIRSNGTYTDSALNDINSAFNGKDGNDINYIMPANGHFGESGSVWKGYGYIEYNTQTKSASYGISGGYNGGFSWYTNNIDVPDAYSLSLKDPLSTASPFLFSLSKEPINMFTGAYCYDNTDISIGAGGFPLGLGLKRHYDSGSRLEDGPFGLGWTHNFDIKTTVCSDGFQSMGTDSPIDAAANIVSLYITFDLLRSSYTDPANVITAVLTTKWKMDQMIKNIVVVKQGEGSKTFVMLPDGSYNPPPGDSSKLTLNSGTYLLADKAGNTISFDSSGNATQWRDPHNNTVAFAYSSGKLSKVSNSFGYSLNFTYPSGNTNISKVTANKGSATVASVTYDYNSSALNYTDAGGNTTRFAYDTADTNEGLLTRIYYPVESGSALFVTNTYDSLGRVIEQTNADNNTYDYYYSYYRTEEQLPAETPPGGSAAQRYSRIYRFDDNGRTIEEEDQVGRETTYQYDGQQRKVVVRSPVGNSVQYSYDNNGNIKETRQIPYPLLPYSDVNVAAHWSFDENEGMIAYDSVMGNTGKIYGATWTTGLFDTALSFDGTDDNVDCGNSKTLDFPAAKTFTIAAWIKTSGTSSEVIFNKMAASNGPGYYLSVNNGTIEAAVKDGTNNSATTQSSIAVNDNNWHHVACVFGSGSMQIYIDGQPDGTTGSIPSAIVDASTTASAFIGRSSYGSAGFFNGQIDEVMVFDSNLSAGDVQKLADANATGNIIEKFTYVGYTSSTTPQWWVSQIKTHTDPNGNQTVYSYDYETPRSTQYGNLANITYPAVEVVGAGLFNPQKSFTYNSIGQVVNEISRITNTQSTTTLYEYNAANAGGTLKRQTVDSGGLNLNIATEYTYDNAGNVLTVTDPLGHITTNSYDNMRRPKATTDALGYTTSYGYYPDGKLKTVTRETGVGYNPVQVTSYTYWPGGEKKEVTDPLSNVTQYEYDSISRLSKVTDANSHITKFRYWPDGQLWKTIRVVGQDDEQSSETDDINTVTNTYNDYGQLEQVKDAKDNPTTYEYDGFGRLEKTIYPDSTFEQLAYDLAGNISQKQNRGGQTINYAYDSLNRLKTKTLPGPQQIQYTYDLMGRLTAVTDSTSTGAIQQSYDNAGRLLSVTNPDGKMVSYQYDFLNRTKLTYPDNTYITYGYDELNRLNNVSDMDCTVIAQYDYTALWRKTSSYANGTSVDYDYDTAGRLLTLDNHTLGADYAYAYTYDNVGNRLTMTANGAPHSYRYDDVYRLTSATYPTGYFIMSNPTYVYDKAGNRSTSMGYVSNPLNQYSSVGGTTYSYDPNGNMTNDGSNSYVYDTDNRLITATVSGTTINYSYDASGRRIAKSINGVITKYVYDGDQIIAEYDAGGNIIRKFVYGTGIDEPVRMTVYKPSPDITGDGTVNINDLIEMASDWLSKSGDTRYEYNADLDRDGRIDNADLDILAANWLKTNVTATTAQYYYHYDGLGSVIAISDSDGNVVETYKYDVYGWPNKTVSAIGNPYLFTGRQFDAETGLYYYRARYYSPILGRFMQTDPTGYEDGINWYAYCGNNPIMLVDPLGTNVFGGAVSWIGGSGFDTSYDMGWGNAGQLGKAAGVGGGKGFLAEVDGAIPFGDPLKGYYAGPGGEVAGVYRFSQAMGSVARDAFLTAAVPNIGTWIKNPAMYEAGSTTVPATVYDSIKTLDAIDKGEVLVDAAGGGITGWTKVVLGTEWSQIGETIGTGLTPGGYLLGIGTLQAADIWHSSSVSQSTNQSSYNSQSNSIGGK